MDVLDFVVETTETDVMPYLHSKQCAKLLSDALSEYLVDGSIDSVHREEGILILRIIVKLIKVKSDERGGYLLVACSSAFYVSNNVCLVSSEIIPDV